MSDGSQIKKADVVKKMQSLVEDYDFEEAYAKENNDR